MTAPVKEIHVNQRRIGELHDKDLVAGNGADRIRINLAGQGVETVENNADIGVIGATNYLPGVAMIVDVATPGQRLVANPDTVSGSTFAQFVKVGSSPVNSAKRNWRYVRADQHKVGAEFAHDVEFPLRSLKRAGAMRLRHPLEVAKWLEKRDVQSEITRHPLHIAWRCVIGQEIIFENLDA